MSAETLGEALEKAGGGAYSADYRGMVARDADPIFKTLARFASPEAKREVLALLLKERLGAVVNWDGDVRFERYGNAVLLSRTEVLKVLTPLEAP